MKRRFSHSVEAPIAVAPTGFRAMPVSFTP